MPNFAAIIPAAGSSTRFGPSRNKLLEDLSGSTVLARSVEAFARREDVPLIVVATSLTVEYSKVRTCPGKTCRAGSVLAALRQVPETIEWVAVHDAARPLISQSLIDNTLAAAVTHGAAGPALPVSLTIKELASAPPAQVQRTVPRQGLWAMQTPQIMRRADLLRAFEVCPIPLEDVTDDLQLLELAGFPSWLVRGEEPNLKITTLTDLALARLLIQGNNLG